MTARGLTSAGNVLVSAAAYHPDHLVYRCEVLARYTAPLALRAAARAALPAALQAHWGVLAAWDVRQVPKLAAPVETQVAPLLHHVQDDDGRTLFFRTARPLERLRDCGLAGYYAANARLGRLATQGVVISQTGNLFHPACLRHLWGGSEGRPVQLSVLRAAASVPLQPVPPTELLARFSALRTQAIRMGAPARSCEDLPGPAPAWRHVLALEAALAAGTLAPLDRAATRIHPSTIAADDVPLPHVLRAQRSAFPALVRPAALATAVQFPCTGAGELIPLDSDNHPPSRAPLAVSAIFARQTLPL